MKKYLYWCTYPLACVLVAAFGLIEELAHSIGELFHHWEAWALDYKKRFPDMHYKGDGIWTSWK